MNLKIQINFLRNNVSFNSMMLHDSSNSQIFMSVIYFFSDTDECSLMHDNCSSNATCRNTVGGFSCSCNQGFVGNGTLCVGKWEEVRIFAAHLFAVIYEEVKNIMEVIERLTTKLSKLNNWCEANKITVNVKKIKTVIFSQHKIKNQSAQKCHAGK